MLRAAVLDDYQGRAHEFAAWGSLAGEVEVTFFSKPIPRDELADTLSDYEALVLMRERRRSRARCSSSCQTSSWW